MFWTYWEATFSIFPDFFSNFVQGLNKWLYDYLFEAKKFISDAKYFKYKTGASAALKDFICQRLFWTRNKKCLKSV